MKRQMRLRILAERNAAFLCRKYGHQWGERVEHHNDPFEGSPHLPGGLVGWSQSCTRCGAQTGRGEY